MLLRNSFEIYTTENGNFWSCEEPAPPILSDTSTDKVKSPASNIPYIDQDVEMEFGGEDFIVVNSL